MALTIGPAQNDMNMLQDAMASLQTQLDMLNKKVAMFTGTNLQLTVLNTQQKRAILDAQQSILPSKLDDQQEQLNRLEKQIVKATMNLRYVMGSAI
jgi:chromosome segregation ATPase